MARARPHAAASALTLGLACASFARPEVAVVALPAVTAYVFCTAREVRASMQAPRAARAAGVRAAAVLAVPALLTAAFGSPFAGTRSFEAFAQHYAFTTARREHLLLDPWVNFMPVVRRDFASASTVREALAANPTAFLRHALHNLRELPSNVLDLCALRGHVTRPGSVIEQAVSAVILVGAFGLLVAVLARRDTWRTPRAAPRQVPALIFVLSCAWSLPAVLVVFPRAHYLVVPCAFGWLLACGLAAEVAAPVAARLFGRLPAVPGVAGVARVSGVARAAGLARVAGVALVAWALVPSARAGPPLPTPMRQTAAALRGLALRPAPVLELGPGLTAYAGYDYPTVNGWGKTEPLLAMLERDRIGIVVLDERWLVRDAFARDPDTAAFLAAPERFGFTEVYALEGFVRAFARPELVGRPLSP
jgi:hypothetical protein